MRPIGHGDQVFTTSSVTRLDNREGRVLECLPRKRFRVALVERKRNVARSAGRGTWYTLTNDPAEEIIYSNFQLRHKWPNPKP